MRVVLYLLALLTGFSAADAARPVQPAHDLQGSASLVASVVISVASTQNQAAAAKPETLAEREEVTFFPALIVANSDSAGFATPVIRNDLAHN